VIVGGFIKAGSSSSLNGGRIEAPCSFSILSLPYSTLNFKSFSSGLQNAAPKPVSARKKAGDKLPRLM